ncbi:aminotransferase class I/II-fold pyridoxal phosphate-dependent enzyme [Ruania suaedae]|uniref:MalY/PatB family protein n=1 Tax=Ruania suaedae TaxID=2897774 RepID=UPI001E571547|nr:aminotransferase class I/II-fold pyridoxal phosphate-dependent enzyme [Ruania suaedae]UFU02201.1 aminotransferase class I/II-fold pyridoxal phosphate-dependent enzyme [Ruania suaedae]
MDAHQMQSLDELTIEQLRAAGSVKWTAFPGKIGAFVAEMDFGTAEPITRALHEAVDAGVFGYLPAAMSDRMSEAYTDWAGRRYGWTVDPGDVHPVADVLAALELTIDFFCEPDSAVVLPTPAYMPFLTVPLLHGRRIIQVPMAREGGRYVYDLAALDAAFADGGGLLVLCNPHNPIGRVLETEEMVAISEVVQRHGARVFSDEIHAPLVYSPGRHVPYASVNEAAAGHTLTATSASKAWNLPGLKCAQVVASNDADRALWREHGKSFEHGAANLGVVANTAAYTAGEPWLAGVLEYLDGNRRRLAELVAEHLPGVRYTPPEGTYLAWLDFRGVEVGGAASATAFLASRAGVATTDGAQCGQAGEGFVRYNLATPRPIMEETVAAMGRAVREIR